MVCPKNLIKETMDLKETEGWNVQNEKLILHDEDQWVDGMSLAAVSMLIDPETNELKKSGGWFLQQFIK